MRVSPDLSRRLGAALGRHVVTPAERSQVIAAAVTVEEWDQLPPPVQLLVVEIEGRGALAAGGRLLWTGCRYCLNLPHAGLCQ